MTYLTTRGKHRNFSMVRRDGEAQLLMVRLEQNWKFDQIRGFTRQIAVFRIIGVSCIICTYKLVENRRRRRRLENFLNFWHISSCDSLILWFLRWGWAFWWWGFYGEARVLMVRLNISEKKFRRGWVSPLCSPLAKPKETMVTESKYKTSKVKNALFTGIYVVLFTDIAN